MPKASMPARDNLKQKAETLRATTAKMRTRAQKERDVMLEPAMEELKYDRAEGAILKERISSLRTEALADSSLTPEQKKEIEAAYKSMNHDMRTHVDGAASGRQSLDVEKVEKDLKKAADRLQAVSQLLPNDHEAKKVLDKQIGQLQSGEFLSAVDDEMKAISTTVESQRINDASKLHAKKLKMQRDWDLPWPVESLRKMEEEKLRQDAKDKEEQADAALILMSEEARNRKITSEALQRLRQPGVRRMADPNTNNPTHFYIVELTDRGELKVHRDNAGARSWFNKDHWDLGGDDSSWNPRSIIDKIASIGKNTAFLRRQAEARVAINYLKLMGEDRFTVDYKVSPTSPNSNQFLRHNQLYDLEAKFQLAIRENMVLDLSPNAMELLSPAVHIADKGIIGFHGIKQDQDHALSLQTRIEEHNRRLLNERALAEQEINQENAALKNMEDLIHKLRDTDKDFDGAAASGTRPQTGIGNQPSLDAKLTTGIGTHASLDAKLETGIGNASSAAPAPLVVASAAANAFDSAEVNAARAILEQGKDATEKSAILDREIKAIEERYKTLVAAMAEVKKQIEALEAEVEAKPNAINTPKNKRLLERLDTLRKEMAKESIALEKRVKGWKAVHAEQKEPVKTTPDQTEKLAEMDKNLERVSGELNARSEKNEEYDKRMNALEARLAEAERLEEERQAASAAAAANKGRRWF